MKERSIGSVVGDERLLILKSFNWFDLLRLIISLLCKYDKLTKLVKDFEPFRNLWITTSDWLRWHESWMNDPLTSIDAENVEKNVGDAYKTMHKSVKIFADIPGKSHSF